jgi:hypothetical protein
MSLLHAHSVLVATTPPPSECTVFGSHYSSPRYMLNALVATIPVSTARTQCSGSHHSSPQWMHSVWQPLLVSLVHAQCPGSHHSCLYCMHSVWQPPTVSPLCAHSALVATTLVSTASTVPGSHHSSPTACPLLVVTTPVPQCMLTVSWQSPLLTSSDNWTFMSTVYWLILGHYGNTSYQ